MFRKSEDSYKRFLLLIEETCGIKLTLESVCCKMEESRTVLCSSETNFIHRLKYFRHL